MKKTLIFITAAILLSGGGVFGYLAYRAHLKLVTLEVYNADLRDVVRQIEWQTWEKILVHQDVNGKVSLHVYRMPLERVLGLLAGQTSSLWMAVYPLYSSKKSLVALRNMTLGVNAAETNGWSSFQSRPPRFGGGGGMRGGNPDEPIQPVSLTFFDKDIGVASLAFTRFGPAQVVPEDGTTGTVSVNVSNMPMAKVVSQMAGDVDREWTRFYAFEPGFRQGPPPESSDTASAPTDGGRNWREPSPERQQQMEQAFAAQLETMSPEERQRAEELRARWQEMRNLSPEERQQRMQAMVASPEFQTRAQNRMLQRLRDSTPEQRAERFQRIAARRAARAAAGH